MSGFYNDDDDFEQDQQAPGPKDLRKALAKAQAELKERDDKIAALEATQATLTKQVKSTTIATALSKAGIDPKYARFAERDEVEATDEAVAKWVEDNREVYAFLAKQAPAEGTEQAAGDGTDEGDGEGVVDEIDPALIAAIQAGQKLEQSGHPGGTSKLIQVLEGTDPSQFKSEAEVDAYIRSLGAPSIAR